MTPSRREPPEYDYPAGASDEERWRWARDCLRYVREDGVHEVGNVKMIVYDHVARIAALEKAQSELRTAIRILRVVFLILGALIGWTIGVFF